MPPHGRLLTEPVAAISLLERSIGYTRSSLQLITPSALYNPTPCRDWNLLGLLHHMDDSLLALLEAADLRHVDLLPRVPGDNVDVLVERLRSRACLLLGAWTQTRGEGVVSVAGRRLDASVIAGTGALEIALHGWDIAQACGFNSPLPESLAEELLDVVPLLVTEADRPKRFAMPLEVLPDAPLGARLLALLGRSSPTTTRQV